MPGSRWSPVRSDLRGTGRRGTIASLILPNLILAKVFLADRILAKVFLGSLVLCLGAAAPAQERRGPMADGRGGNSYANPTAAIAADFALNREARDRGEWTALLAAAAPDAMLMVPQPVWAQTWLKGRANPEVAAERQPGEVWSSCDGSIAITRGGWSAAGQSGWFATVWQRQPDGTLKWQFTDSGTGAAVQPTDILVARVADCAERKGGSPGGARLPRPVKAKTVKFKDLLPLDPTGRAGASPDGSLRWDARTAPDGTRSLTVTWKKDGAESTVLAERAGPGSSFARP
jgi:hypothetical protein